MEIGRGLYVALISATYGSVYQVYRMSRIISLREANQAFSRCIREVEAGEEFTITRNGQPVARLVPASSGTATWQKSRQIGAEMRARRVPVLSERHLWSAAGVTGAGGAA